MVCAMDAALNIAAAGLSTAERAFTRAATDTVRAAMPPTLSAPAAITAPPLDLAGGIVAQMEASLAFRANLAVYRVANSMYRSLLKATGP